MRRSLIFVLFVSLIAACVTIEPPPDPRGAIKPNQRLIVMVHQSPGPWIVADPDSKAETAIKLMPLGNFLQGMQEDRINALSKEIQPYLPRPHYAQAVETTLIQALKAAHGGPVQTAAEAGISPLQVRNWNDASDQLDWRHKYYFTDPARPSPRDYSKILSLDDAVILEVNLSFGLEPDETERTLPLLSAAVRAHRADTARMLWSREERLSDSTSSTTLSEFRATPTELTDRLYALSVPLGQKIAADFARDAGLMPPPPPIVIDAPPPSVYLNGSAPDISTAPLTTLPPAMPEVATSTAPAVPYATETAPPSE
ncbi:MAG: hypothetical protein COV48_15850 [Elusimicrobia bacterium CG11_big_fil_rev_8_21_14_0_20_64_6]|nr:MAG: hypothetical protein COV48_15850 [Elusimicrobia bacterium CG11_big_fil_rev_8_21_14_0_20_64_6]